MKMKGITLSCIAILTAVIIIWSYNPVPAQVMLPTAAYNLTATNNMTNSTNSTNEIANGIANGSIGVGYFISVMGYDFSNLAHDAQLIIVGKVLDKTNAGMIGKSDPGIPECCLIPGTNNHIQVQKVLKGNYPDKTINVVTEGDLTGKPWVEDAVDTKKGEKAVFFLRQEPVYDNEWTIIGSNQGKFKVDAKNQTTGNLAAGSIKASLNGLEMKLKDVLSQPPVKAKPDPAFENDKDMQAPPLDEK